VPKVRRNLEGQLPANLERGAHASQEVEVVVDPLQRGIGEHQIEILTEPCGDVARGKGKPGHVLVVGGGARQHRV
jgi:hypothetical protein